jgi:hypothetical protein
MARMGMELRPRPPVSDRSRPRPSVSARDSPIISPRGYIFNFPNDQHPFYDSSKHTVLTIEEFSWGACDEELESARATGSRRAVWWERQFVRLEWTSSDRDYEIREDDGQERIIEDNREESVNVKRNRDLLETHSFQDLNLPDYQYTSFLMRVSRTRRKVIADE